MRLSPILLSLLLTAGCVPLGTPITSTDTTRQAAPTPGQQTTPEYYADKTLRYQDYIYDPNVRSVQCYVGTSGNTDIFQPPVVPLSQGLPILLEFDVLGSQSQRLTAKLIHCDVDWKPSLLTDIQFLDQINDQLITDYRTSVGTKVPYFHYKLQVPRVKLSGNYLLVVQGPGNTPLLSRRLLVYDTNVQLFLQPGPIAAGAERYTLQQLNFGISYAGYPIINPSQELKVILRQNFRWDNAKYNLRPTFVRDAEQRLEYQYFNFENTFPGLSEFRPFDMRSLQVMGVGMLKLDQQSVPKAVLLNPDASRAGEAYTRYPDINGQRLFESREYGNGDTNADYANVTFQLHAEQAAPGPVYVLGQLTDWQLRDEFRLTYDAAAQLYTKTVLLKQGYYNYIYATQTPQGPNSVMWEGSHQETENQYDLLVYYRPPGTRADLLIGYQSVDVNKR
ncbi:DUF5103 domain-containing protein [Hymenobacter profundi]|uniref:DUF5103 domain-containing protein n=1 Tax=Hymenobacter profundi TaxID=1982110 RepID=A0ABS6WYU6_9BACT|nr:DUF5103 domain-containing protein [Hymenobacter profundi]MBW3128387.1 DUF5103 domain-containing protein [Hymenobacter profundi]